jgi:hypothetical protein
MNIKLPTVDQVLNRSNWTSYTLAELVSCGHITPKDGAEKWIQAMQADQIKSGDIPLDAIDKEYIKIWNQLKYKVLSRLIEIQTQS